MSKIRDEQGEEVEVTEEETPKQPQRGGDDFDA